MSFPLLLILILLTPGFLLLLFHRPLLRWLDGYFYRRLEVESYNKKNPYANGPFAPATEELSNVEATVIGNIPEELSGEYFRNGPNQRFKPTGRMHMFDGVPGKTGKVKL